MDILKTFKKYFKNSVIILDFLETSILGPKTGPNQYIKQILDYNQNKMILI